MLIGYPMFPYVRPIWKREVLNAFFTAEGPKSERGLLWCDAALERPERVQREMQQLLKRLNPVPPPAADAPRAAATTDRPYDLFISHASEDRQAVAEPLFRALLAAKARVWFDKAELKLGDRLRDKIDDGLRQAILATLQKK